MIVGIAGPMSLELLRDNLPEDIDLPVGYPFPMTSMLINALINRGHKVIAYTTSTGIDKPLVYNGGKLTLCIGRREPNAARDLFRSERKDLQRLMKKYPSDVINAQWSYEFAWAALDSRIPTLVTLQDHALTILKYQFDPYRFMRLLMNHYVLYRAKYLSTNSQYLYKLLSKKNKSKTKMIPNFYAKRLENYFNDSQDKKNYIISISNGYGRRKNMDTSLYAFQTVKAVLPEYEYHLVGDGMEEGGPAYQFAIKNNLQHGVIFKGAIPFAEVIKEITLAKVFLHPSREESFGMAVLESMIMGTPIVAGKRSGNMPHLLDNGKAGVLCNINSPKDISHSILSILQDEDYASRLRESANCFAKKIFSEENVISQYLEYYHYLRKL